MAIKCVLCGINQNAFIEDFALSDELRNYRICADCDGILKQLKFAVDKKDADKYFTCKKKIYKYTNRAGIDTVVKNYLHHRFEFYEKEVIGVVEEKRIDEEKRINENNKIDEIELEKIDRLKMTNGYNFEGYRIVEYIDVLETEVVLGTGFFSEFGAGFSDFFGVESNMFSNKLAKTRKIAKDKLKKLAIEQNANAVLGIDFNYNMFNKNLIGIIINGTAVKIVKVDIDE
jgi:uncharacterized protein YbjQ (UPF0145 family)